MVYPYSGTFLGFTEYKALFCLGKSVFNFLLVHEINTIYKES